MVPRAKAAPATLTGIPQGSFLRRHARILSFLLLLMLASGLVAALADRGHDPEARRDLPGEVAALTYAPSGERLYALQTREAAYTALTALTPEGDVAWEIPMNVSHARLATGAGFVAVATAPNPANLTVYDEATGNPLWYAPIPRVFVLNLAADGGLLAVALQTSPPSVQIFERAGNAFALRGQLAFDAGPEGTNQVKAIAVQDGVVAAADLMGRVVAWREGRVIADVPAPLKALSLAIGGGGTRLVVAGQGPGVNDFTGAIQAIDLPGPAAPPEVLWTTTTSNQVPFVATAEASATSLALVDTPGAPRLRGYPHGSEGDSWLVTDAAPIRALLPDRGAGVSLSPDGAAAAYVTTAGDVTALDATTGETLWTYRTFGGAAVTFRPDGSGFAAGVRLVPDSAPSTVLLFDLKEEPLARDLPVQVALIAGGEALAVFGYLALVALRDRR